MLYSRRKNGELGVRTIFIGLVIQKYKQFLFNLLCVKPEYRSFDSFIFLKVIILHKIYKNMQVLLLSNIYLE